MKFLNSVDLAKNQILNVVLHNAAAAPSAPKEGQIYYNTTDDIVYYWDGTTWIAIGMIVQDGDGLSKTDSGNVRTLKVNVDNATLEIASDTVRIKNLGVTTAKLADAAVTTGKIADGAVTSIKILDKNILFEKIEDMGVMTLLGSLAGGTPHEIRILTEAEMNANNITGLALWANSKAYIDSLIGGIGSLIGGFDASASAVLPGDSTTKKAGYWHVTVPGNVLGKVFEIGDVIIAAQNNPTNTNPNHYLFLQTNRDKASTTQMGMIVLATTAEVQTGTDTEKAVTPATLSARTSTETRTGLAAIATEAEAKDGLNDTKFITPKKLKAFYDDKSGCAVADIGNAAALTFNIAHTLATKDLSIQVFENATGDIVYPNVTRAVTTPFSVTVAFGSENLPTANQYRVIIKKIA